MVLTNDYKFTVPRNGLEVQVFCEGINGPCDTRCARFKEPYSGMNNEIIINTCGANGNQWICSAENFADNRPSE